MKTDFTFAEARILLYERNALRRRVFLLSGWRRWLSTHLEHTQRTMSRIAKKRGVWGILVHEDDAALEYQRLARRQWRAGGSRSHSSLCVRAQMAARKRQAVWDAVPEEDRDLWMETFDWWDPPRAYSVHQSMDDGSWSMEAVS